MQDHELKQIIQAADRAISAEDFETLMGFYSEDATLVVKPDFIVNGKAEIKRAFSAIAEHFNHQIKVTQGDMKVIEGSDTALVIMETRLETLDADGIEVSEARQATYVFRKETPGGWLCVIDNSYGTTLLNAQK